MNGPEHYAEAEHVLDHAEEHAAANSEEWYANAMAAAQVHATLAPDGRRPAPSTSGTCSGRT